MRAGSANRRCVRTAAQPSRSTRGPYLIAAGRRRSGSAPPSCSRPGFGVENVDLVFLTAVVGVAVRYGSCGRRCLRASCASLCYNFFFLPPVYTFTITDPTNVAAFFFFMRDRAARLQRRRARCARRPMPR